MTFVDKAGIKVSGIMKDGQDIFPDTRFYRFIIGADGNLYKAYYDPEDQQGDEAIISEIVNVKRRTGTYFTANEWRSLNGYTLEISIQKKSRERIPA